MMCFSAVINYPLNIGGRPLLQLAGVHPDHVRADGPVRRVRGGASACSASTACRCPITRSSTCPASRWPRGTGSSSASRRTTRCSTARRPGGSSRAWSRKRSAKSIIEHQRAARSASRRSDGRDDLALRPSSEGRERGDIRSSGMETTPDLGELRGAAPPNRDPPRQPPGKAPGLVGWRPAWRLSVGCSEQDMVKQPKYPAAVPGERLLRGRPVLEAPGRRHGRPRPAPGRSGVLRGPVG